MELPPDLVPIAAAAAEADVSSRTIESKIASGELESVKVAGRRLVRRRALEAWTASRTPEAS
jgi:excisionase family DNA binding protein